ncbi:uncharacterized protein LOC111699977 [Eurytemora carolleeae]|uniref:uncharacterized protein LOC111699977 n=1 Tax=Eurytemora carolleeae TaxID=1294199 RepID=UPI000C78C37E|nr:uncharacterized protein LOC111699977 [Eurytemora carolleeae]|eukprot:XP_023326546.1 uncharacterized protein LOC111699977 [Eurytemora affinis]
MFKFSAARRQSKMFIFSTTRRQSKMFIFSAARRQSKMFIFSTARRQSKMIIFSAARRQSKMFIFSAARRQSKMIIFSAARRQSKMFIFSAARRQSKMIIFSAARRQNGVVQCICVVKVPGVGILHHPLHPDTTMIQKNGEKGWKVEGIDLEPIEPMKKWRVRYNGDMVLGQPENSNVDIPTYHRVNLDAVYTSDLEYFDFDSDMEPMVISRAMAREPWSAAYFQKLRAAHQNHYEQFGTVSGKLTIDQTEYDIGLSTMRDHTHGSSRDWKLMHRYGLHNFTTSSGLRGFLGIVSQPGIFSTLELGYIYTPDKQKHAVQIQGWR